LEVIGFDLVDVTPVIRIVVIYRPPYYDTSAKNLVNKWIEFFTEYVTSCGKQHMLVDNLKLPHIDCGHLTCPPQYVHSTVFDFIIKHGFSQFVTFCTRQENIRDVILCDDDLLITRVAPHPSVGHSDHIVVEFEISVDLCQSCSPAIDCTVPKYHWSKTNFDAMSAYLTSVDWATLYSTNPCAGTLWSVFCQVLSTAINLFVPCTSPVPHTTNTFCKKKHSVPKNMRKCEVRRRKLWRKLRSSPNDIALQIRYQEC